MSTHKFRKRQRDVFSRLTTPIPQKETSIDPRIAQPEYGVQSAQQRKARPQAKAPAWPTPDDHAKPGERATSDPEQTLSNDRCEPKFLRTEEASTRSTINRRKFLFILTRKISQKQAPTQAFGKQSGTFGNTVQCKQDRGTEMH